MELFKKKKYQASGSLSSLTFTRFVRNKLAVSASVFIIFSIFIALLGYIIIPDKTPFANDQALELATKKPGFKIDVIKRELNRTSKKFGFFHRMLFGQPKSYQEIPIVNSFFTNDSIYVEEYTGMQPNNGRIIGFHLADIVYSLKLHSAIKNMDMGNIEFTLDKAQNVTAYIYNLNGQVISQIAEYKDCVGTNLLTFSTYPLSSGTFVLRLYNQNGEIILRQKFIKY